jgi:hypothetical protein
MFQYNPKKRPTTDQIMKHAFFSNKIEPHEMQRAWDVINGKSQKTSPQRPSEVESLKVGPHGIQIKKENIDDIKKKVAKQE